MNAPSEKHLEDWIYQNPQIINPFTPDTVDVVARQMRLQSGIPDLIAMYGAQLRVIELKKDVIDIAAITQLMRYMAEIRSIWNLAIEYLPTVYPSNPPIHFETHNLVSGLAIGAHATTEIINLASAAGITIMTYDFANETYSFQSHYFNDYDDARQTLSANGELGRIIRWVHMQYASRYFPDFDVANMETYWQKMQQSNGGAA